MADFDTWQCSHKNSWDWINGNSKDCQDEETNLGYPERGLWRVVMSPALEGMNVIDCCTWMTESWAARVLGNLRAKV